MNLPSPDSQSNVVPVKNESIHERTPRSSPPLPPCSGWIPSSTQSSQSAGDHIHQFPWRLHQMLETVEKEGKTSIISWLPGDPQDTFKVHDKDKFMQQVLPRFFNQTKFKSFLRQLNLWGFERILESGPRRGGYRHSLFIKNQPFLCTKMKRTKIKGAKQGDTGDSQQQQTEGEQHHCEAISHRSDDAGGQRLTRNKTNFLNDEETSFDTIEYEKIPDHVPVAADLSRMYDEMYVLLLPPAEAEEHSPILPQPTTNLKRPAIM